MIIDFHTHAFPDELAPRALKALSEGIRNIYPPANDGTARGLLQRMDEWAIDISVIHPVVTKPTQMKTANEWAAGVRSDRLLSFGGLYPHTDTYKADIDFIVSLGLLGLKLHPEYQDFHLEDPHMLRIYDYALSKGLILLIHAGFDPAFPAPYKSSPKQFASLAKTLGGGTIVAAHLGGHGQWEETEAYLAGADLYMDTSMGLEYIDPELFVSIVQKHGADKILFASDAPWSAAGDEIGRLMAMPLSDSEKEAILGGNAIRILGLDKRGGL